MQFKGNNKKMGKGEEEDANWLKRICFNVVLSLVI